MQMRQGIQTIEVYGVLSVPELSISTNGINFDMVETVAYSDNFGVIAMLKLVLILLPIKFISALYCCRS